MNRRTNSSTIKTGIDKAANDLLVRPAEADELDFENDQPAPGFEQPELTVKNDPTARNAGLTEASQPGEGPTNDDLTQETLILEDGARSQHEPEQGCLESADHTLSIIRDNEINAGGGFDEAETAKTEPWNRKKHSEKK